jgi:hypothetical protein
LGITPLALELLELDDPTLLEELEATTLLRELLDDDFTLEDAIDELDLTELELETTEELDNEQLPPATTPKGAGCAAQVDVAIQLLPFS